MWEKWYRHENSSDVKKFVADDLRQVVHQFCELWNICPPADKSESFAMGAYTNEIRECIKNYGMAPRVQTHTTSVPLITQTRISRSTYNQSNVELLPEEVVVASEAVSPVQGISINPNMLFIFISLEYLRQIHIKELATLEYIVYTMGNDIEIDTQYLTMTADVTMADVLTLDCRRKAKMKQHIIVVRNDFISNQVFQPVDSCLLMNWLNDAIEYNKQNDNASRICHPKFEPINNFEKCQVSNQMILSMAASSTACDILFEYRIKKTQVLALMQRFAILLCG